MIALGPMDLHAIAQQVVEFVHNNGGWAVPVVFGLAFGESLAFISLLIPAWGALVAIGALIGHSGISFWPIWVSASLGAAFGDWLSYWIGLKLEYTVAHMWPLSRHPDLIPRGEAFMKKWGVVGNLYRPVLRTFACFGAFDRRHFRNAVLAIPDCQFRFRIHLGGDVTDDR